MAPVWLQLPCKLQKYKFTNTQHKLVLGRHTLAARKPLSSYNDKGKAEHKELFGCLSVCHTLPTLSQDPSDTGYLLTLRLPDGSNLPPPPPSLPPLSKSPQCPVSRGWIEAASSLTKLVKGVSHQLGLWHICLSTPESPETTVVTRHVTSHSLVLPYKYQTKPLWSFIQLHGNINICVHHQRPLLSPGMSVLTSNPFSPLASESLLLAIPR